jgi:hypothetical protein
VCGRLPDRGAREQGDRPAAAAGGLRQSTRSVPTAAGCAPPTSTRNRT